MQNQNDFSLAVSHKMLTYCLVGKYSLNTEVRKVSCCSMFSFYYYLDLFYPMHVSVLHVWMYTVYMPCAHAGRRGHWILWN